MALFLELVNTVTIVLIKPLSLLKLTCFFGVRTICIVIQTWTELLRAAMGFHASLLWRLIIWAIAILSLPIRSLTALQRERMVSYILQEFLVFPFNIGVLVFEMLLKHVFFPFGMFFILLLRVFILPLILVHLLLVKDT